MSLEHMPPTLTIFYRSTHPSYADIRIAADNDAGLILSVVHKSQMGAPYSPYVDIYDFLGDESSEKIGVEDKDVLVFLAERAGALVGTQVFEVSMAGIPAGYLLVPRGGANILYFQEEQLRASDLDRLADMEDVQAEASYARKREASA